MTTQLIIIRHGNTFDPGDTVLRVGGRTDLDLSRSGQAQAAALGAEFANQGVAPREILAGPLKRTRQTADAIALALGGLSVQIEPRLTEIDYGPDEGKPEDEVVARLGVEALSAWESQATVPPGWRVDPVALKAIWQLLFSDAHARGGTTLAVTSNGIARFALPGLKGADTVSLKLKTGAYGVVGFDDDGSAHLVSWNQRPSAPV